MKAQFAPSLDSTWQQLEKKANHLKDVSLISLFDTPQREKLFSITLDTLFLDYSKNKIDDEAKALLLKLAKESGLEAAITGLFQGERMNTTENRSVLHPFLRSALHDDFLLDGTNITPLVRAEKQKMYEMVRRLNAGEWQGATGQVITDVVNIGIGGSDLGPVMAVNALNADCMSPLKMHFVSNIDPLVMERCLAQLNPHTTLFVISSKSFSTPETFANAEIAKAWLLQHIHTNALDSQWIGITANVAKASAYGIASAHILHFWEWVGGRYSLWSTIGFPLALQIGAEQFDAFLEGARTMDNHFANAPLEENMPVILALLGIWYIQFFNAQTYAVLPYVESLKHLPAYLQQLDMESNGKSVQKNGEPVSVLTGPIVWGQSGTNGQHAFYQLLHQGTHCIPTDFILCAKTQAQHSLQHEALLANGIAQTAALMVGAQSDNPWNNMPGDRVSNTLLLKELTPYTLGQLIALYEHKVFVQGIIWQINSFDQPGVELGKILARAVQESFTSSQTWDPSTQQLIDKIKHW